MESDKKKLLRELISEIMKELYASGKRKKFPREYYSRIGKIGAKKRWSKNKNKS